MTLHSPVRTSLAALATLVALAACASSTPDATATTSAPAGIDRLTVTDPWVKAADEGMTAAFAVLENPTGTDLRIVSASTDAATSTELHETAHGDGGAMVMRPKDGGIVVPAGGEHVLAPGGDHLMLMGLTAALRPGDEVVLTLTGEDGSTLQVTAPARSFSGAQEEYVGGTDEHTPSSTEDGHGS